MQTDKEKLEEQLKTLKEKKAEYEVEVENADVLQHSIKILLNSAYGAFGSTYYPLYDVDIAESTTIGGKTATLEMIRYVNNYMNTIQNTTNEEFVIAGDTDSVSPNTVITINNETIEELFNKYKSLYGSNKLSNGTEITFWKDSFNENQTYSINGLTSIVNISRHKISKERYKIKIDNDEIEITGDHSIMVYRDGCVIECKPSEIKSTDCLLKLKDKKTNENFIL